MLKCQAPPTFTLINQILIVISHVVEDMKGGNLTEWQNYTQVFFGPIADKLAVQESADKVPMNLTVSKLKLISQFKFKT